MKKMFLKQKKEHKYSQEKQEEFYESIGGTKERKRDNWSYELVFCHKIEDIKKEINKTQKELLLKVLELQKINEKIQKLALNKNHIQTENDYIKNLMDQQNHMNKDDYVKKLKEIQNLNDLFIKMQNIKIEELENCSDDELNKKIEY